MRLGLWGLSFLDLSFAEPMAALGREAACGRKERLPICSLMGYWAPSGKVREECEDWAP